MNPINASKEANLNMEYKKWLKRLLFETKLFDLSPSSPNEDLCINRYLKFEYSIEEISEEWEIAREQVMPNIRRGLDRVVDRLRQIITKNEFMEDVCRQNKELKDELAALRNRFQKELANEPQKDFPLVNFPISAIVLSIRTRNILSSLNIKTLNDLRSLTREMIEECNNAGQVTLREIEETAKEYGIELKHKKE